MFGLAHVPLYFLFLNFNQVHALWFTISPLFNIKKKTCKINKYCDTICFFFDLCILTNSFSGKCSSNNFNEG